MISELLNDELKLFLKELLGRNFRICLVGGAVRDFFKSAELGRDLDFEIRQSGANSKTFLGELNLLINFLKDKRIIFEELPYGIIKFQLGSFNLEFSPPRVENFNDQSLSHHNFSPVFNDLFSYHESFKRRDFTINAIGFEFFLKNDAIIEYLIDPFHGKKDIELKVLRPLTDDFYRDPVRFLRIIRFQHKLDFTFDKASEQKLVQFNLTELSWFHFFREMKKIDISQFLNSFSNYVIKFSISVNKIQIQLSELSYPERALMTFEDLIVFLLEKNNLLAKEMASLQGFSLKRLKALERILESRRFFLGFSSESFQAFAALTLQDQLIHPLVIHCRIILERSIKTFYLDAILSQLESGNINLHDFEKFQIDSSEINALDPKIRSNFKVIKFLIFKIKSSQ